jgi:membrane-associated protease RseP (regulator of RpoE activity)
MAMRGGRLGVGIQTLGPQLGEYFGLGDRTGVLVTTVQDDSPAAKAGLKAGDVIVAVDGEDVEDPGDVSRAIREAEAGPLAIRILREREERTVTVELPEPEDVWRSDDGEASSFFFSPDDFDFGDVHVEWLSPEAAEGEGPAVFQFDTKPGTTEIAVPRLEALPPAGDIEVLPGSPEAAPGRATRRLSI